jgi:hypothetical protein
MHAFSVGIVVFGDIVHSRRNAPAGTRWLEHLRDLLEGAYAGQTLAPFEYTQGDELQGLLQPGADPFQGVILASLRSEAGADAAPRMRWSVAAGEVDPGSGPATRRTGEAFLRARSTLQRAARQRDRLLCQTGRQGADLLLDDVAPVVTAHIDRMTDRQREVARLMLVDGLRQAEVADVLRIKRPTVSIAYRRGDVRSLGRLLNGVRAIWRDGLGLTLDGELDQR